MASTSWFVSAIVTFFFGGITGRLVLPGVMHGSVLIQVELNGKINSPGAPEYVHFFFSMLAFVSGRVLME